MSLRLKFVLALLLSSLASVALVGGVAYVQLTNKFDSLRRQQASMHFKGAVTDYLTRYGGNWQTANEAMSFHQFMAQRRPGGGDRRPPPQDRDPGPDGGPRRDEPPFRFILLDRDYRVLMGAGSYPDGSGAPVELQRAAIPITINDRVEAYVSPQGVLAPGKQDIEYLAAMREALGYGAAAATALALGLGLLLGNGLSAALRQLTAAVKAMRAGALRQKVAEIGRAHV